MTREISSKVLDGINDLVILAPIKDGFIHGFDNISHATRLRIVAQALNDIRATAREFEKPSPFSDASERILSLLDFRVGVLDQDLFQLDPSGPVPRRYMYLIATFDGVWESYMRLIWRPLGPLLDLLLCNCEGYVRATENSSEDYLAWVRSAQIDSAVFFTTTGITVSDQVYLRKMEVLQRIGESDAALIAMTLPDPAEAAAGVRAGDPRRANRLALEALGVLFRLSDFYPPLAPQYQPPTDYEAEDGLLLMAAHTILEGWNYAPLMDQAALVSIFTSERVPDPHQRLAIAQDMATGFTRRFGAILEWFHAGPRPPLGFPALPDEAPPIREGLQSGIVRPQGTAEQPATHGALLMFSVTHSERGRDFIGALDIALEAGGHVPADRLFRTIGFTRYGLERLGLDHDLVRQMPKAFREGMAARASAIGDLWDHHPGNWQQPQRYGVAGRVGERIDLNEVDFVVQLRCAPAQGDDGAAMVAEEVKRLAGAARESGGAALIACEAMQSDFVATDGGKTLFRDHFGLIDGISQPWLPGDRTGPAGDRAMFGDVLCGYRSSQRDVPSQGREVDALQKDGSFLVIRKLRQHRGRWDALVHDNACPAGGVTPALLAAKILGRHADGTPLVPAGPDGSNDFDYAGDAGGALCPLGSHIRRANPRAEKFDRPVPRVVRRGMSYGPAWPGQDDGADRGLMFMAYNANIADQFETIQRWLNGGNSTGIASMASDPLTAPVPRQGERHVYRFLHDGSVVRTEIREPLVELQWGLYLFVPSRAGLDRICANQRPYFALQQLLEKRGATILERLNVLPEATRRAEWKRLLEDHDAKDPAEQARTPDLYAAIRWFEKGAVRVDGGVGWKGLGISPRAATDAAGVTAAPVPSTTVVASADRIMAVLADHDGFGTATQLARLQSGCGAIYVSQYPDAQYSADSAATNAIMQGQTPEFAYASGYTAARAVLDTHIQAGEANYQLFGQHPRDRFTKLELRREFIAPSLAALCQAWFGLPDGRFTKAGHWNWQPVANRADKAALIPGDIYAISRHAFYPNPGDVVAAMAQDHGKAVYSSVLDHVKACRNGTVPGALAQPMFAAIPQDDDLLARNLLGMLVAAIPPMDGNLRGILAEWLGEKSLWRHQAALRRAASSAPHADHTAAKAALELPIAQAMCKRPSPDLLHRRATKDYGFKEDEGQGTPDINGQKDDLIILSLVSATQAAIADPGRNVQRDQAEADDRALKAIPIIFGGDRYAAGHPVHACPGRALAMGAMTGMLAALLDCGRIEAQPAGLIIKISDWPARPPAP